MSLTFNMVGGGGSGAAGLPAIYAEYPAGSVCTCTNGSKTFTAKDTTGFWLFVGLELGTWTVTTTDPTGENNPVSQAVELTDNQLANVELRYVLWLYKDGNEYTDITGGWNILAGSNANGYLNLQRGDLTGKNPMQTQNANIDFADYKTLCVHFVSNTISNWACIAVGASNAVGGSTPEPAAQKIIYDNPTGWQYLDISAISLASVILSCYKSGTVQIDQIYASKEVLT